MWVRYEVERKSWQIQEVLWARQSFGKEVGIRKGITAKKYFNNNGNKVTEHHLNKIIIKHLGSQASVVGTPPRCPSSTNLSKPKSWGKDKDT